MKIVIHCFTGTGNTARAAELVAKVLRAAGHSVEIRWLRRGTRHPEESFDLQVFAFCVLSWSAPVMMKRYLRALPPPEGAGGRRAAVLAVNGGMMVKGHFRKGYSGQALEQAEGIIRRRGYEVFLTASASFPENWTQFVNPLSAEEAEAVYPLGEAEVREFTRRLLDGGENLYRCGIFNRAWSGAMAWLFGAVGRRLLGRAYIADERCSACGLCAATCPAHTIRMSGRLPRWGANCEDCNRCINICPEQAIQASLPLLLVYLMLHVGLTAAAVRAALRFVSQIGGPARLPVLGLGIIGVAAAAFVSYWVVVIPLGCALQALARLPGLRRFFRLNHTSRFRRYKAPGFRPAAGD